ncbi:MAG TPA: hypothetical protein VEI50_08490, partial [Nitrospiraceae bacterium]|nr:hypothetical protein [Nitrospiraceae bacterium]
MEYLSDATKRERRSLLATAFAGVIIALLKNFPTEFEVVGMKFQSPDLPFIAVGGLCVVIFYLLIKFSSSYLYERSSATKTALEPLISERKTTLDIIREEESLAEEAQGLAEKEKVIRLQQEGDERQISDLQQKMKAEEIAHVARLKITDQQINELEQMLAIQAGQQVRTLDRTLHDRGDIEKQLGRLKEDRLSYVKQREMKYQQEVFNLENERNRSNELRKALIKDLQNSEGGLNERRRHILRWK